eukprot:RCo036843
MEEPKGQASESLDVLYRRCAEMEQQRQLRLMELRKLREQRRLEESERRLQETVDLMTRENCWRKHESDVLLRLNAMGRDLSEKDLEGLMLRVPALSKTAGGGNGERPWPTRVSPVCSARSGRGAGLIPGIPPDELDKARAVLRQERHDRRERVAREKAKLELALRTNKDSCRACVLVQPTVVLPEPTPKEPQHPSPVPKVEEKPAVAQRPKGTEGNRRDSMEDPGVDEEEEDEDEAARSSVAAPAPTLLQEDPSMVPAGTAWRAE